jgi:carboxylate-amine ligase
MADGLTAEGWRTLLDGVADHTVGVEEELMLLDPATYDLLPAATRVMEELGDAVPLRPELPAAQVETASPVCATIAEAAASLAASRRALAAGVDGWARLAGAGAHPFAAPEGPLRDDPKYERLIAEFRWVLPRQLVFGQHVHVAVRGADRALAVYNALRSHLPDIAVLAGNAPYYGGRDTGLASLRPKLCDLLPRQGVPPAYASWEERAEYERWGRRSRLFPDHGESWWELRPHDELGTIELRVPDAQCTAQDAAGVLAFSAGLVAWLAERHDAGEALPVHDTTRIVENRWRALRHGLGGSLLDLDTGEPRPARERVLALIDAVGPAAERLGGAAELEHARSLAARNGAERQRALAAEHGPRGLARALADAFLP